MIVEQYGIKYSRVTEQDLETLRYWRNQSFIRNTMQFKEYISPFMQREWFEKINNKSNFYFIISIDNCKIGLISCKEFLPDSKISEGGIFIWDVNYWGTSIPAYASLTMLQAVFDIFQSGNISVATVACDNKKAIDFNFMLGYEIKEKILDDKYYRLILSKEKYQIHCAKLIRAAGLLTGDLSKFKLFAKECVSQTEEINFYIKNNNIKPY